MNTVLEPIAELPFFVILLLLLAFARVLGELMERIGQPAMMGEILAGILLGPSVLNLIHMNSELTVFSQLGVFMLVIIAGMEISVVQIVEGLKGKNILISLAGFFIPLVMGLATGFVFELALVETLFISLCISITALPISVRILMDLNKLNTDIGNKIIAAAIFNDVVALSILGILLDGLKTSSPGDYNQVSLTSIALSVGFTLLKVIAFIVLVYIAFRIIDRLSQKKNFTKIKIDRMVGTLKSKESLFAIIFVFILGFASVSEAVGLHFVIGAFFGAMLLSHELLGRENFKIVEKSISTIAMGFLAPIFLTTIGLQFKLSSLTNIPLLIGVLVVSFVSKIVGGYLGGKGAGFSDRDSLTIGVGLNARGIMELVIANIALAAGFISSGTFSILVLMGIATTFSTPLLLKKIFKN
jgi:Kef-type K+ transport system membrane component KefB